MLQEVAVFVHVELALERRGVRRVADGDEDALHFQLALRAVCKSLQFHRAHLAFRVR